MAGSEIIISSDIINSTSELWVLKTLGWFRQSDVEGKGYFVKEEADEIFGARVQKLFTKEEQEVLPGIFAEYWEQVFAPVAVTQGGRTVVMWSDFLEFIHSNVGKEEFKKKKRSWLGRLFAVGDKNHDGILSSEEFARLTYLFGFKEHESKISIAVLDKECKGQVSVDTYVENWIDYYHSLQWDESTLAQGSLPNVKIRTSTTYSIRWNVKVPETILEEMGELWVRKLLTLFRHYDVEGSGAITWSEVVRAIKKRTENKVSPQQLEGVETFGKIFWDMIWAQEVSGEQIRTTIKWSDFIEARYEAATKNRAVDEKLLSDFHAKVFEVIDANHDSSIQLEEYLFLTAIQGLTRHQAVVSFTNIDINGDGTISYPESLEAWRCFIYSKEWGSGTLLYGTLDNARIS